jgi:phosphate transport system protein
VAEVRVEFHDQLRELEQEALSTIDLASAAVDHAIEAVLNRDTELAVMVIEGDDRIDGRYLDVHQGILSLLARQSPVASDLRLVAALLHTIMHIERVGDLAVNIAEAARRYAQHAAVKRLIDIPQMAGIAQSMLRDSLDAFVRLDTNLAQQVLNEDDKLDALKTQIFRELLTYMLQDPSTIEPALDLILISRHLERIGDHATNIAEDVIFIVSARDVRHHVADQAR